MAPGRTWAPIDTLKLDHAYMVPNRFEPLRDGRIEVVADGYYGVGGRRSYGFEWADSAWRVRWTLETDKYWAYPSLTPPDHQMLVWKTTTALVDSGGYPISWVITADVVGNSVTAPDTISRVPGGSLVNAGASWGSRRWVATQYGQNYSPKQIFRLYRSDYRGPWVQMRTSDLAAQSGLVMAPLDSSSVLVVTAESNDTHLHWGVLRDTTWSTAPEPFEGYGPHKPSVTRLPAGGVRIAWSSYYDFIQTSVFREGAWAAPETVYAALPDTFQHLFFEAELSREESDHPALAWYGYKIREDVAYYIWVAFPTDSGFGLGEKLPGSWEGINPTCLQDENGDVWVAWWRTFDGMYWTHSYCTATASTPAVSEEKGRPRLDWSLSESAPRTWWAILRSVDGALPEPVARVRAGPSLAMSWADSTAPAGAALCYSIRRECRDVRYRATSAESEWRPRGSQIALAVRSENPAGEFVRVELSGANAGPCDLVLYDLQGRQAMKHHETATGSGVDRFELPLSGHVRPGLYLLRVRGGDGRFSRAAKVVVIR